MKFSYWVKYENCYGSDGLINVLTFGIVFGAKRVAWENQDGGGGVERLCFPIPELACQGETVAMLRLLYLPSDNVYLHPSTVAGTKKMLNKYSRN